MRLCSLRSETVLSEWTEATDELRSDARARGGFSPRRHACWRRCWDLQVPGVVAQVRASLFLPSAPPPRSRSRAAQQVPGAEGMQRPWGPKPALESQDSELKLGGAGGGGIGVGQANK